MTAVIREDISDDYPREVVASSNLITGYLRWPERRWSSSRLPDRNGPLTTSHSIPCSSRAFCTRQQGWRSILTHIVEQRLSLTGIPTPLAGLPRDNKAWPPP